MVTRRHFSLAQLTVGAWMFAMADVAAAAPDFSAGSDPSALLNGTPVPECAWAPVVELYDVDFYRCTPALHAGMGLRDGSGGE